MWTMLRDPAHPLRHSEGNKAEAPPRSRDEQNERSMRWIELHPVVVALMAATFIGFWGLNASGEVPHELTVVPLSLDLGRPEVEPYGESRVPLRAGTSAIGCSPLTDLPLADTRAAVWIDDSAGITHVFVGSTQTNAVIRHRIDAEVSWTTDTLPIPYGLAWVTADLDRDGNLEIVVQRGDGVSGFLDIHSAPDWSLRTRIVMPGMRVEMFPVAVNIDSDEYLELYLTPKVLGGDGRVQLIKYDPIGGGFIRIADIPAPPFTSGPAAVGDLDGDGNIEFVTGSELTYSLFEYKDDSLSYIGDVGGPYWAETHHATTARPFPDGEIHLVLGYSSIELGYRFQLLRATGDNAFELAYEIIEDEPTGWSGFPRSAAIDFNCDGRDDLLLRRYPGPDEIYTWNDNEGEFLSICGVDHPTYGSLIRFFALDLNRNGIPDLAGINTVREFFSFEGECTSCLTIPTGAIAWWALDELSGATAHDTWNTHHATAFGTPIPIAGYVAGAWSFDGTADWLVVPDAPSQNLGTGDFTIDGWIITTGTAAMNPVFSKYQPAAQRGIAFWIENGERLALRLGDGSQSDFISSNAASIADGGWHHIAVRVDRDDPDGIEFYLDGELLGSANPVGHAGSVSSFTPLYLARMDTASGGFRTYEGALDEVRLFDRALSSVEIRSVVAVGPLGNCKPVSYVCACPDQADLDSSGAINAVDLTLHINVVFFGASDPQSSVCPVTMADFNADGQTNAVDLALLIDYVFFGGTGPAEPCE